MKAQRLQIAQALLKIAPNVTANDRKECAQELNISKQTICYYLTGRVSNNDRALQILEFFIQRIDNRQKDIKQLCQ
jgi:orotate phosphoribosyltransferase-like protein